MIEINTRTYNPEKTVDKGVLYRVNESCIVDFTEQHEDSKDIVSVEFCLENGQYGVYAHEYKRPELKKDGCKVADVLAYVVNEETKEIVSFVFDVKRDISAFSDDLLKDNAMLVAIKEVRDFLRQIHDELLHKNSFFLYFSDAGYIETENIGIVTTSFEMGKFKDVATTLENLMSDDEKGITDLITFKLKKSLRAYENMVEPLYNFADRKAVFFNKTYKLSVFIMQKLNEQDYGTSVKIANCAW